MRAGDDAAHIPCKAAPSAAAPWISMQSIRQPEMRFWYIIPNLLRDNIPNLFRGLLTSLFKQVHGLSGSPAFFVSHQLHPAFIFFR
jgi:hypothetical protein